MLARSYWFKFIIRATDLHWAVDPRIMSVVLAPASADRTLRTGTCSHIRPKHWDIRHKTVLNKKILVVC